MPIYTSKFIQLNNAYHSLQAHENLLHSLVITSTSHIIFRHYKSGNYNIKECYVIIVLHSYLIDI